MRRRAAEAVLTCLVVHLFGLHFEASLGGEWQKQPPATRNPALAIRLDISGLAGDRERAVSTRRKTSERTLSRFRTITEDR